MTFPGEKKTPATSLCNCGYILFLTSIAAALLIGVLSAEIFKLSLDASLLLLKS